MSVDLTAEGLPELAAYLRGLPQAATSAARLALNQTADRVAVPRARAEVERQVAFPDGYLNDDRLGVSKRATAADLESVVTGRERPTGLARFAPGASLGNKQAITVVVNPGHPITLRKAWLVRLRAGASITEDNFNIGLAVRLKPGASLRNKFGAPTELSPNVYLLYGPSVGQVFRDVADQITPEVLDSLGDEFLRQFNRLAGA